MIDYMLIYKVVVCLGLLGSFLKGLWLSFVFLCFITVLIMISMPLVFPLGFVVGVIIGFLKERL